MYRLKKSSLTARAMPDLHKKDALSTSTIYDVTAPETNADSKFKYLKDNRINEFASSSDVIRENHDKLHQRFDRK